MNLVWVGTACVLLLALMRALFLHQSRRSSAARFDTYRMGSSRLTRFSIDHQAVGRGVGRSENVSCAAVGPRVAKRGSLFRVRFVLARPKDIARELVATEASVRDAVATDIFSLSERLRRGACLETTLLGPGKIAPTSIAMRWAGRASRGSFQVELPADYAQAEALYDLSVFLDRVCIGMIPLSVEVTQDANQEPSSRSLELDVPRRIFVSYTRVDRPLALTIARAYQRLNIDTFMDRLSLEGGDLWEERIEEEIARCDMFLLIWSKDSSVSEWVCRETLFALRRRKADVRRKPHIVTHIVGAPPPARAPDELRELQFNDPAFALWEAEIDSARSISRAPATPE
jgi:hypothetical protein